MPRRSGPVMVGDDQPVFTAAKVAYMLNQPDATLRTVGAEIGVSAAGVHRLMRDCGYRMMWVTVAGACVECGAPNGGGYVTPGCDACSDTRFVGPVPRDAQPKPEEGGKTDVPG